MSILIERLIVPKGVFQRGWSSLDHSESDSSENEGKALILLYSLVLDGEAVYKDP